MKKMIFLLALFIAFGSVAANAMEKEEAAIYEVISSYYKNINGGDSEKVVELLTDDVVYMPPLSPEIQGKEKAKEFSQSTHQDIDFDFSYRVDEIEVQEDTAYVRSTVQGFIGPKAAEYVVLDQMKAIHILKKEAEGWKIALFIFNSSVPLK